MRNQVDVVIVLGASLKNASTLSPQTIENLSKLKELNLVKVPVILSGGYFKEKGDTEALLMLNHIDKESNHFKYIHIENESGSSDENVRFCLDIIQEHQWRKVAVIDQPLHLFQLRLLFKHYIRFRKLDLELNFIPAKATYGSNVKWWQYSHPWVYNIYLILCTCYYVLKGKITLQDII